MENLALSSHGTKLTVMEDKISLEHSRALAKLSKQVEISFSEIKIIKEKKPGLLSGYACFIKHHEDPSMITDFDAMGSEQAIVFKTRRKYNQFLKLREYIQKKILDHEQHNRNNSKSLIDQLVDQLISDEKHLVEYKTSQGALTVKKHTISISYKALHKGGRGKKDIDISSITSIHLSKSDIRAGRIRFFVEGSHAPARYQAYLASENELLISGPNEYQRMYEAKAVIERLRVYHSEKLYHSISKPSLKTSPADEIRKYKTLLDDGIISEEEFEKKKQELLR